MNTGGARVNTGAACHTPKGREDAGGRQSRAVHAGVLKVVGIQYYAARFLLSSRPCSPHVHHPRPLLRM